MIRLQCVLSALLIHLLLPMPVSSATPDHIILVMADDMGWGQTEYANHPILKTPNLNAMAANGLRFDRFYAGAPNCSPTRATVLTGRTNDRTGVLNHGVPLRPQEKTVAQALKKAGYATAHFGKWHLNGMRGPGAPILKDDIRSPGAFGFDTWLSVTNFFDRDPILSRMGKFEEFQGDSSEIIVDEAVKFIQKNVEAGKPSFSVIWYGTPHSPFMADEDDKAPFPKLKDPSLSHYGELVAMDRSIGTLRSALQEMDIAENTFLMFNSDNGGLPRITPGTVGNLRGFKNSVYEGGLRVPAIIEWPAVIQTPRVTQFPACTMDIFPTLVEIAELPESSMLSVRDGMSITPLFQKEIAQRPEPMGFRHTNRVALIDNDYKLITQKLGSGKYELYNLKSDQQEKMDLLESQPEIAQRMIAAMQAWNESIEKSIEGDDYPEGKVIPADPGPSTWMTLKEYEPYLEGWKDRPEFRRYIKIQ
ncbi:Arylsulfatase precursor [Thalassoglobus polymorphus]|uniref:Arylsulfatase n=2 Tax=Thalassoglobus polymorphus TaxID=2527994 RepID=A0A517QTB7_9PLAN|nr:Arylsulfatase precursor [Thalassoglobus polymorphus]